MRYRCGGMARTMADTDERPRTAMPQPGGVILLDRVIEIPPFSSEEIAYIEGLQRAASEFDDTVKIGGARAGLRKGA